MVAPYNPEIAILWELHNVQCVRHLGFVYISTVLEHMLTRS